VKTYFNSVASESEVQAMHYKWLVHVQTSTQLLGITRMVSTLR